MKNRFAIFNQTITCSTEITEFLALLGATAGDHFFLCIDTTGKEYRAGRADLCPAAPVMAEVSARITAELDGQSPIPVSNGAYHLLSLPEMKAALLFSTDGDHTGNKNNSSGIGRIVHLCHALFQSGQEQQKIQQRPDIQKKQFNRKFSVLEHKYQSILEENEKSYRTIQGQQANYPKTLQSEIKIQTRQLRVATAAETASIAKSEFLASKSHELRTPINDIIVFTNMLLTSDLNHEQKDCAMTANAMKGDREECLDAGMNDYISKPIKREIVFRILEERLLRNN